MWRMCYVSWHLPPQRGLPDVDSGGALGASTGAQPDGAWLYGHRSERVSHSQQRVGDRSGPEQARQHWTPGGHLACPRSNNHAGTPGTLSSTRCRPTPAPGLAAGGRSAQQQAAEPVVGLPTVWPRTHPDCWNLAYLARRDTPLVQPFCLMEAERGRYRGHLSATAVPDPHGLYQRKSPVGDSGDTGDSVSKAAGQAPH